MTIIREDIGLKTTVKIVNVGSTSKGIIIPEKDMQAYGMYKGDRLEIEIKYRVTISD